MTKFINKLCNLQFHFFNHSIFTIDLYFAKSKPLSIKKTFKRLWPILTINSKIFGLGFLRYTDTQLISFRKNVQPRNHDQLVVNLYNVNLQQDVLKLLDKNFNQNSTYCTFKKSNLWLKLIKGFE